MSVDQIDVVDIIGTEGDFVILTISDHLDWDEDLEHLSTLQEKLNAYISFIESGELLTAYPQAAGKTPVIDVVMRVAPNSAGTTFLDQVRPILLGAGIELRTRVFNL